MGGETFISFNRSTKEVPLVVKAVVDSPFLGQWRLQMFDDPWDLLRINHGWNRAAIFWILQHYTTRPCFAGRERPSSVSSMVSSAVTSFLLSAITYRGMQTGGRKH